MHSVKTKSSAVSVCSWPPVLGRESVAIRPSGSPVEKENDSADAGVASRSNTMIGDANALIPVKAILRELAVATLDFAGVNRQHDRHNRSS